MMVMTMAVGMVTQVVAGLPLWWSWSHRGWDAAQSD